MPCRPMNVINAMQAVEPTPEPVQVHPEPVEATSAYLFAMLPHACPHEG